ncbi:GNAT family N-acetyltransferase [uncultured Dokdonia sp.]|uniref:GNAT family N-acetyltransferase n=1 Tax=uncultured Dokdonia sp. TaxID=575653 RepID=UPI002607E5BA|nr:GNAT family N-acetyltransferase [uncultured Dokdonia sp.]
MNIELITKDCIFLEKGIVYFWKQWGSKSNFDFYKNCIENSLSIDNALPKFYLMIENNTIIGSYALLTNDLISRQDLMPWFACLYVDKKYRNQGIAKKLLAHGLNESYKKGYDMLYLCTDLIDFYEKYGWNYFDIGYHLNGDKTNIYSKATS